MVAIAILVIEVVVIVVVVVVVSREVAVFDDRGAAVVVTPQ